MTLLAERGWGGHQDGRPAALLLHGITSSSRTWWRVGPALADRGFAVLAVDLRSHGASPAGAAGLSLTDLAADVADTAAERSPFDLLVGHSLGGLVALELLAARPRFARRLVLEDPPGSRGLDRAGLAAGIEADTARARSEPRALRAELLAANEGWVTGEADRRLADLADCDGRAVAAALRDGMPFDLPGMAGKVEVPTLLLLGEEALGSNLAGPDRQATVEALRHATTRVLPSGHNLHREAFDAWFATFDAWFAAIDART